MKCFFFFFNYTCKFHFLRFLAEVIVTIVAFFLFFCFSLYINGVCPWLFSESLLTTDNMAIVPLLSIVTAFHCIILSLVRKATAWRWLRRRHFRFSKRWSFYSRWTRPCKMQCAEEFTLGTENSPKPLLSRSFITCGNASEATRYHGNGHLAVFGWGLWSTVPEAMQKDYSGKCSFGVSSSQGII